MPKTGSRRTADWRKKLIADGYKQKAWLFSPAALKAIEKLGKRFGSEREGVEAAVKELAARKN